MDSKSVKPHHEAKQGETFVHHHKSTLVAPDLVAAEASDPVLASLGRIARGDMTPFAAFLETVDKGTLVGETQVTAHCHCVKLDGNGKPRVNDFINALCDNIVMYCIPRSRIKEAYRYAAETGDDSRRQRLSTEAKTLFSNVINTGEGGELLVFVFAEKLLHFPQIICKMGLKTSSQVHFHGADGVYAEASPSGGLRLYWGESKIYAKVTTAIAACLKSISPILLSPGGPTAPDRRDLQLLSHEANVDDPALEKALLAYLDPDNALFNQVEYRGIGLVGFNFDGYPGTAGGKPLPDLVAEIVAETSEWHEAIRSECSKQGVSHIHMHFFCIPLPSAANFRESFIRQLGL